jgi:hypothetical protein
MVSSSSWWRRTSSDLNHAQDSSLTRHGGGMQIARYGARPSIRSLGERVPEVRRHEERGDVVEPGTGRHQRHVIHGKGTQISRCARVSRSSDPIDDVHASASGTFADVADLRVLVASIPVNRRLHRRELEYNRAASRRFAFQDFDVAAADEIPPPAATMLAAPLALYSS